MTSVLQDTLNEELLVQEPKIIVQQVFDFMFSKGVGDPTQGVPRSKTFGKAKSLLDFHALVRQAIDDYETRASVPPDLKINFTEEEPDAKTEAETITFSLMRREPGGFGQGAPFESNVRNLRPIIRENGTDPANPGYRTIVMGYWHDNIVRYTCWARTNKAANARAMWLENMMEEYTWWFTLQGVQRVIYWGQGPDTLVNVDNNRWYGRPIDFYVKTETLRTYSEKTLEQILVRLAVK
jgi:hypothetical protein